MGRVRDVSAAGSDWRRVDGERVSVAAVPDYSGPIEYVRARRKVIRAIRAAVGERDGVLLRVGSQIAACLESGLRDGRPFGLEVLGDSDQVFAPGAISHPLRPFLRWWFGRQLRSQCRRASAVSYATGNVLQRLYPASQGAYVTSYVNLELEEDAFVERGRTFPVPPDPLRIVSVGAMSQPYKGFDVLIDAVSACARRGLRCELSIVGDGARRRSLEELAERSGAGERVHFLGTLPAGPAVRAQLDRADLFVLASKTEGLPKVMVEAMARALPCLGSAVGGIPELLDEDCLFPRGDAASLARLIGEVGLDPARLTSMSAVNLERSRRYGDEVMDQKRQAFLCHLHGVTLNDLRH